MKLFSALFVLVALFCQTGDAQAARLIKLGQTQLDYRSDMDFVRMPTHCNGFFNKRVDRLMLVVRRNDANIDYLAVQYGNGVIDRLPVRERFRQGSTSRWIDLRGGERCVKAVALIGDTQGPGPKAVVEFYGLDY